MLAMLAMLVMLATLLPDTAVAMVHMVAPMLAAPTAMAMAMAAMAMGIILATQLQAMPAILATLPTDQPWLRAMEAILLMQAMVPSTTRPLCMPRMPLRLEPRRAKSKHSRAWGQSFIYSSCRIISRDLVDA